MKRASSAWNWRTLAACWPAALVLATACGRIGFAGVSDGGGGIDDGGSIDVGADSRAILPIAAAGVWDSPSSELRRTLATSTSTTTFTFATWYKSAIVGAMVLNAGVTSQRQTFVWDSANGGRVGFQHQVDTEAYAAYPSLTGWPYTGLWVHIVLAVDLTQPALADRVRLWYAGVEQALDNSGGLDFMQGQQLYLGDTVLHTLGNKWDGAFDWDGSLAETYVIWGHALRPDSFIELTDAGVRSVAYAGPVTPESVYFDYAIAGENRFAGEPAWTATAVASTTSDLPY